MRFTDRDVSVVEFMAFHLYSKLRHCETDGEWELGIQPPAHGNILFMLEIWWLWKKTKHLSELMNIPWLLSHCHANHYHCWQLAQSQISTLFPCQKNILTRRQKVMSFPFESRSSYKVNLRSAKKQKTGWVAKVTTITQLIPLPWHYSPKLPSHQQSLFNKHV